MTEKNTGKLSPKRSKSTSDTRNRPLSGEIRHKMIAEAAYYRAERRGFGPGDPVRDWLMAEQEVDSRDKKPRSGARKRAST